MKRLLPAFALLALACGAVHGPAPQATPPTAALAKWQGFPAGKVPRPIVLLANRTQFSGFETNDGKIAALCGKYVVEASLSARFPGPVSATWADGTRVEFPPISAAAAAERLMHNANLAQNPDCATVHPLVITSVQRGVADLETDRGAARIDSWLFQAKGATGYVAYPALPASAFWGGGPSMASNLANGSVVLGAQGTSFGYRFYGAPADGACGASYTYAVAESDSAVAIALQAIPNSSAPVACPAIAALRTITVVIERPLGGRVLADANGEAMVVCTIQHQDC